MPLLKLVANNSSPETDTNTAGLARLPDTGHSPSLSVTPDEKVIEVTDVAEATNPESREFDPSASILTAQEVTLITIEPELEAGEKSDQSILDGMLEALGNDDNAAVSKGLGVLYERYYGLVYRFAMFRTGDVPLAEDFAQETFVRALSAIQRGRVTYFETSKGIPNAGAWLVTISRNLMYDHFKSARVKKAGTAIALDSSNIDAFLQKKDPSAEDCAITSVQAEEVREAISHIKSTEQRRVIELRFLHDYSPTETAEICGINTGAAKALQHRAIKALARILHDCDPIALNENY